MQKDLPDRKFAEFLQQMHFRKGNPRNFLAVAHKGDDWPLYSIILSEKRIGKTLFGEWNNTEKERRRIRTLCSQINDKVKRWTTRTHLAKETVAGYVAVHFFRGHKDDRGYVLMVFESRLAKKIIDGSPDPTKRRNRQKGLRQEARRRSVTSSVIRENLPEGIKDPLDIAHLIEDGIWQVNLDRSVPSDTERELQEITLLPLHLLESHDEAPTSQTRLRTRNASRLMAVIVASDQPLSLDDLSAITGIAFADIAKFIENSEHLFQFNRTNTSTLTPTTRVLGREDLKSQTSLLERHLGKSAMQKAHEDLADWMKGDVPSTELASRPARFQSLLFQMTQAGRWKPVLDLVLDPDVLTVLRSSGEGEPLLERSLRTALIAAAKARDVLAIGKVLALLFFEPKDHGLTTASLHMRTSNAETSLAILGNGTDEEYYQLEYNRLLYLHNSLQTPHPDAIGVSSHRPLSWLELAVSSPQILRHVPVFASTRYADSKMIVADARPFLERFICGLAMAHDPTAWTQAYELCVENPAFKDLFSADFVTALAERSPDHAAALIQDNPKSWMRNLSQEQSALLGRSFGANRCRPIIRGLLKESASIDDVEALLHLLAGLPVSSPKKTTRVLSCFDQALALSHAYASGRRLAVPVPTLMHVVREPSLRLCMLKFLCLREKHERIDWLKEIRELATHFKNRSSCRDCFLLFDMAWMLSEFYDDGYAPPLVDELLRLAEHMEYFTEAILYAIIKIKGQGVYQAVEEALERSQEWVGPAVHVLGVEPDHRKRLSALHSAAARISLRLRTITDYTTALDDARYETVYGKPPIQIAKSTRCCLASVELATRLTLNQEGTFTLFKAIPISLQFEVLEYAGSFDVIRDSLDWPRIYKQTYDALQSSGTFYLFSEWFVALFGRALPAQTGQLLRDGQECANISWYDLVTHIHWRDSRAVLELMACCPSGVWPTKSCVAEKISSALEQVLPSKWDGDPDSFALWCKSTFPTKNRFVQQWQDPAYRAVRARYERDFESIAIGLWLDKFGEKAAIIVEQSSRWPLILNTLTVSAFAVVWRHFVSKEFDFAIETYEDLVSKTNSIGLSNYRITLAWQILVDNAICTTGKFGVAKAKWLLSFLERTECIPAEPTIYGDVLRNALTRCAGFLGASEGAKALERFLGHITHQEQVPFLESVAQHSCVDLSEVARMISGPLPDNLLISLVSDSIRPDRFEKTVSTLHALLRRSDQMDVGSLLLRSMQRIEKGCSLQHMLRVTERLLPSHETIVVKATVLAKWTTKAPELSGTMVRQILEDPLFLTLSTPERMDVLIDLIAATSQTGIACALDLFRDIWKRVRFARWMPTDLRQSILTLLIIHTVNLDLDQALEFSRYSSDSEALKAVLFRLFVADPKRAVAFLVTSVNRLHNAGIMPDFTLPCDFKANYEKGDGKLWMNGIPDRFYMFGFYRSAILERTTPLRVTFYPSNRHERLLVAWKTVIPVSADKETVREWWDSLSEKDKHSHAAATCRYFLETDAQYAVSLLTKWASPAVHTALLSELDDYFEFIPQTVLDEYLSDLLRQKRATQPSHSLLPDPLFLSISQWLTKTKCVELPYQLLVEVTEHDFDHLAVLLSDILLGIMHSSKTQRKTFMDLASGIVLGIDKALLARSELVTPEQS